MSAPDWRRTFARHLIVPRRLVDEVPRGLELTIADLVADVREDLERAGWRLADLDVGHALAPRVELRLTDRHAFFEVDPPLAMIAEVRALSLLTPPLFPELDLFPRFSAWLRLWRRTPR